MIRNSFYTWSIYTGFIGGIFVFSFAAAADQALNPVIPSSSVGSGQQTKEPEKQQIEKWKKEAEKAANDYVAVLDKGEYARSWELGGEVFRSLVSQEKWVRDLNQMRKPLGTVASRQLIKNEFIKDPYDILTWDFILVEYETAFENAPQAREILFLRSNPQDERWYVGSYEILVGGNVQHPLDPFFKRN